MLNFDCQRCRQINENMVKHAVNLAQDALRSCGKTLRRCKVAILGPAYTSLAMDAFVKLIEQKGAKVNLYDPTTKKERPDSGIIKTSLSEAVEGADCVIVLSGQGQFSNLNLKKLRVLMKAPSALVDVVGMFERAQVETEGFIYAGLGRGTERND